MTADDTLDPVVARELEELEAAFAAPLRDAKPEPTLAFTTELDRRAAAGFPRRRRRRVPSLAVPGLALSGVAAALVVVAVLSGGNPSMDASSGGASSAAPQAVQEDAAKSGDSEASGPSPSLASPVPPAGGSPRSDGRSKRFVERSAAITLAAPPKAVADTADRIVAVADRLGGFVVSSSVTATEGPGGGGEFVLRVPASRLQEALAQLSRIGHVRERRQEAVDITAEHTSAADRLAEARAVRRSLLRRLARATTDAETASLRAQLREVDRRIALDKAALRRVDNRARYANVAVSLVADPSAGSITPDDDSSWTPGDAARDALRVLEVAAGVLLIALAVALPLGIVLVLVVVAVRISARRGRERALDAV
jgi:Domain of unknown function (DUF4349)